VPLYDYDCANCGRRFEVIHGVHAEPPTACPLCGGGPVKKAFAAPAVHFKGSGWAKKERRASSASAKSKDGGEGSDAGADKAAATSSSGGSSDSGSSGGGSGSGSEGSPTGASKGTSNGTGPSSTAPPRNGPPSTPASD
jgi:putative FmdB family regulatory protein